MVDALEDCEYEGHRTHVLSATAPVGAENLPAPQSLHVAVPVTVLYVPPTHATHVPPLDPVYPRLHTQLLCAVDPATDCEFTRHAEQEALPMSDLYVFTAHAEHVPPLGPVVPAAHSPFTQSSRASLPADELLPTGQSRHVEEPLVVLYLPAAQAEHVPPLSPVNPGLQTQLVSAVDPTADCVLLGQARQVLSATAPVAARYLPAPQSVHVALSVVVLNFPAAQAKHVPPLGPVNPRLQTQLVSTVDPTADCVFDGHATQVLAIVAPVAVEYVPTPHVRQALPAVAPVVARYVPAPQLVHVSLPVVVLNFPAAQAKHVPPLGPANPRLQTQLVSTVDPAIDCVFDRQVRQVLATVAPVVVEYVPAPQSVHVAEPVVVLNFPAAQSEHVPPSGPVYPRLQTHLLSSVDPAIDEAFAGQVRQVLATFAPVVVEYLPAPQSVHATEPWLVLYFPAAHSEHVPQRPVNPSAQFMKQDVQELIIVLPCAEVVLSGHSVHAILPELLLYVPTRHSEQDVPPVGEARLPVQAAHAPEPVLFLNVCVAQAVHGPPFGPGYPALHMHWAARELAAAEFEPTGQAMQTALPVTAL